MRNNHINWPAVELEYRAGIRPITAIADEHDMAESAIRKRALKEGWTRDLAPKIKYRADELVQFQAVREEVREEVRLGVVTREAQENALVEANAVMQADIIRSHRSDIVRNTTLATKLYLELEAMTDNKDLFARLGDYLDSEDSQAQGKRMDIYNKVVGFSGRIDGLKKLTEVQKMLIAMEREANGITSVNSSVGKTLEQLLEMIDVRPA